MAPPSTISSTMTRTFVDEPTLETRRMWSTTSATANRIMLAQATSEHRTSFRLKQSWSMVRPQPSGQQSSKTWQSISSPPPPAILSVQIQRLARQILCKFIFIAQPPPPLVCAQWAIHLDTQQKLLVGWCHKDIYPERLPIAAGILQWLYEFEEWLRSLFPHKVFELYNKAPDRMTDAAEFGKVFLLGLMAILPGELPIAASIMHRLFGFET
jgi:hypothetical protein